MPPARTKNRVTKPLPPRSWWTRAAAWGRRLETALLVVLLGGLVVFSSAQIVLRNVFSVGIGWGDGLVRLSVLWLALLGAVAASAEGRHINVGALTRWLPPRLARAAGTVADLFAAAVSAALAWFSLAFVNDSRQFGDTLLDGVPAWPLQAIMPVAFALIACRYLRRTGARWRAG